MNSHLIAFAAQLRHEQARNDALWLARMLYDLGHRQDLVRALVCEARLHNHAIIKAKRTYQ